MSTGVIIAIIGISGAGHMPLLKAVRFALAMAREHERLSAEQREVEKQICTLFGDLENAARAFADAANMELPVMDLSDLISQENQTKHMAWKSLRYNAKAIHQWKRPVKRRARCNIQMKHNNH